jgi:hypothetical protein
MIGARRMACFAAVEGPNSMNNIQRVPSARLPGLLYLVVIVFGAAALLTQGPFIISGDAVSTAENIREGQFAYRLGLAANFLATVAYLGVIACLGVVLAPAGRMAAVASVTTGCAACGAAVASSALAIAPLALIDHPPFMSPIAQAEAEALSYAALRIHGIASNLILGLFGCYCLITGLLAMRASFLRRWPGLFLAIAGVSWIVAGFAKLIIPAAAASVAGALMMASIAGESIFAFWIIIAGLDQAKWRAAASRA